MSPRSDSAPAPEEAGDAAGQSAALRALAALEDPSRQALYAAVRAAGTPVSREQAAITLGISRKLAAFHLDKLVDAGLLVSEYDATTRARALGRTPKTYRPGPVTFTVSVPERHPEVLAELLLVAIATSGPADDVHEVLLRVAGETGADAGARIRADGRRGRLGPERALTAAERLLRGRGYEPVRESSTCVRLQNCPFAPLAARATDLVCGLNHRLVEGVLRGLEAPGVRAVLAPSPGRCCVELRA